MPASQAANRTPGTGGISGSRAGAKGETFAAPLAIVSLPRSSLWHQTATRACLRLRPRAGALALHRALDLWIDVLDLSLAPQVRRDLLGLLVDHGGDDPILDGLEGGSRALAAVVDPDDVPTELALDGIADL